MRPPSIYDNNRGFTLVELAIALMVIGLLMAGVLKGQELVENARITRTFKDLNDHDAAVTMFRSIYNGELPGDIKNAATRIPNCATAPCNNTVGVGTFRIDTQAKSRNFWLHLNRAGLVTGINEAGDYNTITPLNPFRGNYGAANNNKGKPAPMNEPILNCLWISEPETGIVARLRLERAKAIDTKMDDGLPTRGMLQTHFSANICHHAATFEYLTNPALPCILYANLPGMN